MLLLLPTCVPPITPRQFLEPHRHFMGCGHQGSSGRRFRFTAGAAADMQTPAASLWDVPFAAAAAVPSCPSNCNHHYHSSSSSSSVPCRRSAQSCSQTSAPCPWGYPAGKQTANARCDEAIATTQAPHRAMPPQPSPQVAPCLQHQVHMLHTCSVKRPMASSPCTTHFCVSQFGSQLWLMKRPRLPCTSDWQQGEAGLSTCVGLAAAPPEQRR